jgi:hypothetical protein
MRRTVSLAVLLAAVAAAPPSAQGVAAPAGTWGAMSAFKGKVSCHRSRGASNTIVRCWALVRPGEDAAMSTRTKSGRLAHRHWKPPVGKPMVFGHQYTLGNGVTCSFRYRHPTDTTTIRSVICSNAKDGPLVFATPKGLSANINP